MAKEFLKSHLPYVNKLKILSLAILIKEEPDFYKPSDLYYCIHADLNKFKYLVPLYYNEINYVGLTSVGVKIKELSATSRALDVGNTTITGKGTANNYCYLQSKSVAVDIAEITSLLTSIRMGVIKGKSVKTEANTLLIKLLSKYKLTSYVGYIRKAMISSKFEKGELLPDQSSAYWITQMYLTKVIRKSGETIVEGEYLGEKCDIRELFVKFPWDTGKLFKEKSC